MALSTGRAHGRPRALPGGADCCSRQAGRVERRRVGWVMSIATDLALALDPVLLFTQALGVKPDQWQTEVLRSEAPRQLLNCCRQSGKSTVTSVLSVHTALYEPESLVLLLSPSLRQSQELFRKCLDVYRALDRPTPAEEENRLTLELV